MPVSESIPSESELMILCQVAARKAIEDTLRKYVPAWNTAGVAYLRSAAFNADTELRTQIAHTLWLANCYQAQSIASATRQVFGTLNRTTVMEILRDVPLYPRPLRTGFNRNHYVLRGDVISYQQNRKTPIKQYAPNMYTYRHDLSLSALNPLSSAAR